MDGNYHKWCHASVAKVIAKDKAINAHWQRFLAKEAQKDAKKVEANDDHETKAKANNGDPQMEALQELMKMSVRRQLERSVDLQEQMRSRGITLDFNVDAGGLTLDFKRDAKKK